MMRIRFFAFLLVFLAILGWSLFGATHSVSVLAQGSGPTSTATPAVVSPHQTNDCLACHSNPNMVGRFADGKTMSLYYDPKSHEGSNHIDGCRACHDAQQVYPHKVAQPKSCEVCHSQILGGAGISTTTFDIPSAY
jgi:Cytochrome c7 and related cytochrome c